MMTHAPNPLATTPEDPGTPAASSLAARLHSLDALRGLTIALMILVQHQRRWKAHLSPAAPFSMERVHPGRRCLSLLPVHGGHLFSALAGREAAPWHPTPRPGPTGTPTRPCLVCDRDCHQRFSPIRSAHASYLWRSPENRNLFLFGHINLPVAAPTRHCLDHHSHPAGLLDTPPVGSRAWLRLTQREHPIARPAWQPACLARPPSSAGKSSLSPGIL